MLRRRRRPSDAGPDRPATSSLAGVDPTRLEQPWRSAVEETLEARRRLHDLAGRHGSELVRDRLASVAARVDAAVLASWQSALDAQAATRLLETFDLDGVQQRLKDARRRLAQAKETAADTTALETEVNLLAEQHAALNEVRNRLDDAGGQLRLLDLRVDAAVARAATLVFGRHGAEGLADVERELTVVVDELEALRAGLDAVGGLGR